MIVRSILPDAMAAADDWTMEPERAL